MDPKLLDYATPRQREILQAIEAAGGVISKAANMLGVDSSAVRKAKERVELSAAKAGWAPGHDMTKVVPPGFQVKGVSSYYNATGQLTGQWVKSSTDDAAREQAMRELMEALAAEYKLKPIEPTAGPSHQIEELCTLYVLTDCHIGMRSWSKETGTDWDLSIAEETLCNGFDHLISGSPNSEVGFVAQLGDFLHFDGLQPITPTSGNVVDADSRYSKVVQMAVKVLRHVVSRALQKHNKVVVLVAEGNHDLASSVWLRHLFALLYAEEPRAHVIQCETPYYAYSHGDVMLAFHHGHLRKPDDLPMLFASEYPMEWGLAKHRYAHCGHMHHLQIKEASGMTVVQHPTLAGRDSYASRNGWAAGRKMIATTYHSAHGEVGSGSIVPEMLG